MLFVTVPIVLLLGLVLPASSTVCPQSINARIQECVRPVADYAKIINNQEGKSGTSGDLGGAFSLPNMGGRVFNELCRLIAKFNSCVRDQRSTCPRHVTISLIDSSYGYLCNEGYNTFMESAECLMELDRKPAVKKCHDETLKEIESANSEGGIAMGAKLDRMCGALNFFSGCVRAPIKQECGFSAWKVIYRVLKDTTNTLMPACQFTGTSQKLSQMQESEEDTTTTTSPTTTTTSSVMKMVMTLIETTTSPTLKKTMRKASELKDLSLNSSCSISVSSFSILIFVFYLF